MDTNTKIGCMAGCLVSVGIFIGVVFLFSLIIAVAFRGCSEMQADSVDAIAIAPQDANQFKKVWLSGDGDEDVAHVLKIRISGVMSSKIDRPVFGTVEDTSAPTALRKIKAAIADESIDGLYLEIDTPGGGVTMADELHDAILRFRQSSEGRFVFVHMGDLCCSGGYYAAAGADWIMARPTTLTGSIGVIMSTFNIAELARKIGVADVTIASGENKDMLNPLKPVKPEHVKILEEPVKQLYERFVRIVAEGRNLPVEVVRQLADGRVFTADDALKHKLVDGIGHEDEAIEQIKKLADGDVRIYGYRKKNGFMSILENSLLLESSDGLLKKARTALIEEESPRAEYRLR
ncbi:MAG: signal peptide peptidase SppA [Kiritimatiellae bacterium]|jgi:protease-4|nr:signal peptide peptidase SppA [Kiritimatiellia bacterium]